MVLAVEAGHRMDRAAVEKWMLWTLLGGITFLSCQAWEWTHFIVGTDTPTIMKVFNSKLGIWQETAVTGANLSYNQYGPRHLRTFSFLSQDFTDSTCSPECCSTSWFTLTPSLECTIAGATMKWLKRSVSIGTL